MPFFRRYPVSGTPPTKKGMIVTPHTIPAFFRPCAPAPPAIRLLPITKNATHTLYMLGACG